MFNRQEILSQATQISQDLQSLEVIQQYKQIEHQIHQHSKIAEYMKDLKQNQKQSVNFQNYDKPVAYRQSEDTIAHIQSEIDAYPIVTQFRQSQGEANEILHLVIDTLAHRLQGDSNLPSSDQHQEE
ncbi:hypothetical protein BU679_09135 [Staphylococcus chromogenes]|uniref:YlbF family regulator n=1 Tax=Staphylococcus chromogenes TaxID=46126 RepID=UPI000D1A01C0|nr:YlbF family regulator [Staphylococcus chromogenes]MCE4965672.1 RicAFT regulatory complex protein RicA family protein [Staphylococcus chromogenes]PTF74623.1 hypothetical protein BUX97_08760 [Staphylococcus chromogenes]PTG50731.1 hypothetical protein BU679_09135 [Staphylococcus chromogenes]RIM09178.1 hypothetical protein BU680_01780 [Staphylococcus chromogenes]